ncbi:tetratricopeptide repeat protein [Micromonospora sp. DR5-3]|uniref:AfsR/SARP family transcriptional regulator n=1 Tax=Micromonospora sp. DR5-3 TaxID=2992129 RepID=UPI0011D35325|nr:BTAD domain-containing putative transcriptional regulator [Micromonospora sp. DR5-3]MCW3815595.1 tetratricopeptide repeat protein [Micromonospora sp. DR5-3]TYC21438.1 tetratricopeptide repeat protein [Micromonospora sp. MP36]
MDRETAGGQHGIHTPDFAFNVLGSLEVRGRSGLIPLPGARQRVVLAALLLRRNRVVSVDELIDGLWPESPPATAREQVLTVVSSLRRLLGDTGRPGGDRLLVTRSPGYLLRIEDEQLDLARVEQLLRDADQDGLPLKVRAAALRAALALWRGPELTDVPSPFAASEAHRLAELRLATTEKLVDAEFALNRHAELVPELTRLVAEHPLRERLRGQLMTALDAVGRTAEALEVYRAGRRRMADELGIEPGVDLQRLERAILAGTDHRSDDDQRPAARLAARDAAAEPEPRPAAEVAYPPVALPAQLPADVGDFTGRVAEVDELCRRLTQAGPAVDAAVPVVIISGIPGVGKSALATHVGHRLRARFPDGQLYVGLRGTHDRPQQPAEVLGRVLVALGTHRAAIPDDVEERILLYRSITAERRVLVVLDDAASAAQVRPLVPGGSGCAVLVTSRSHLTDVEGGYHLDLDVLPDEDGLALLRAMVGAERVAAEPSVAARLLELCGWLPLAVRIVGARLASRPHWSLHRLADRLADQHRLDELHHGDLEVRASLQLSFRGLEPDADRAGQLLALLAVPSFPSWAAGAVLQRPVAVAEALLDQLVQHRIVEYAGQDAAGQDRYRFHDLVGLLLRERAAARIGEAARRTAVMAGLNAWLGYALSAMRGLPDKQFPGLEPAISGTMLLDPGVPSAAATDPVRWYEAESESLLAGVRQAYHLGLDELCGALAHVLGPFLEMRGAVDVWRSINSLAEAAAERAGDRRMTALAMLYRSRADEYLAVPDAARCAERAAELFEALDDDCGQAHALNRLTYLRGFLGHLPQARQAAERALVLAERVGSLWCAARARQHLGAIEREHGRLREAEEQLRRALDLYTACDSRSSQADAMNGLARVYHDAGRFADAIELLTTTLSIFRELRDPYGEVITLYRFAGIYLAAGRDAEAVVAAEQALAIAEAIRYPTAAAEALSVLAAARRRAGRLAAAADLLAAAISVGRNEGERWLGRTLLMLGDIRDEQGDHDGALAAWREAADLLHGVAHPSARDADSRLAAGLPLPPPARRATAPGGQRDQMA